MEENGMEMVEEKGKNIVGGEWDEDGWRRQG